MDLKSVMVLVKGKDETENVKEYKYINDKTLITYNNGQTYAYNKENVDIHKCRKMIKLDDEIAYNDDIPIYKPKLILDFKEYIRIINHNEKSIVIEKNKFSVIKNSAGNKNAQKIMKYFKNIVQHISDNPKEEAFLQKEINQLIFIHPESVLSSYLNRQPIKTRNAHINSIIFPFRFNLSQKSALENALTNSVSVIEGPPGTGKTQTILNLIANLAVVQGKSVAIVSNNNEAVKNVSEKMTKQNYGFLTAFLGRCSNQKKFFADMPIAKMRGWNCNEQKAELVWQIEIINKKINHLLNVEQKRAKLCQELRAWKLEQTHFEKYYASQDVDKIVKLPLYVKTPERIISFLAETSLAKKQNNTYHFLYRIKLLFKYGVFDYKKLQQQEMSVLLSLQKEFYLQQISKLEHEISDIENKLKENSFDELRDKHQQCSEKLFRKYIYQTHSGFKNIDFNLQNFKAKFKEFIQVFPVILSTTYSLRRSIPDNYLLDYVIIDEASQVDILTGILALSCCRNVIVVGYEATFSNC